MFLKSNFTDFLFHRKLAKLFMLTGNCISSYWKPTEGNSIVQLGWGQTPTPSVLRFSAAVAGAAGTTTLLLDSSGCYWRINGSAIWALLAHRPRGLIQGRLSAEQAWPFLKHYVKRKKIVLWALIRYCYVLSLQKESQKGQKALALPTRGRFYFLENLVTGLLSAWKNNHPKEPRPLGEFVYCLKRSNDTVLFIPYPITE